MAAALLNWLGSQFRQIKARNNDIVGTHEEIYDCNYALETEKVMKVRKEKMVVLHEKIVTFQKEQLYLLP